MPEKMINIYRKQDDLSSCIEEIENKLRYKRYFSKRARRCDEATLRFMRELREIKNTPALKTLRGDDLFLAQYDIIRIVGQNEKTITVYNIGNGDRSNFIYTLEDCLQAAIKMMLPQEVEVTDLHFIVIASNPLSGIVIEYGNHGPKFEQIGVTCGYA